MNDCIFRTKKTLRHLANTRRGELEREATRGVPLKVEGGVWGERGEKTGVRGGSRMFSDDKKDVSGNATRDGNDGLRDANGKRAGGEAVLFTSRHSPAGGVASLSPESWALTQPLS